MTFSRSCCVTRRSIFRTWRAQNLNLSNWTSIRVKSCRWKTHSWWTLVRGYHGCSSLCLRSCINKRSTLVNTSWWNSLNWDSWGRFVMWSTQAIIGCLIHGRNPLTFDKCIDNKLETFLALNHLGDKLSFTLLVNFDNVWFKLFIATSNLSNHVVSFLFKMDLV